MILQKEELELIIDNKNHENNRLKEEIAIMNDKLKESNLQFVKIQTEKDIIMEEMKNNQNNKQNGNHHYIIHLQYSFLYYLFIHFYISSL